MKSFPIYTIIDLIYKELSKNHKRQHVEVNNVLKYDTMSKKNFILRIIRLAQLLFHRINRLKKKTVDRLGKPFLIQKEKKKLEIGGNCLKLIEYLKNERANMRLNIRQTKYLNLETRQKGGWCVLLMSYWSIVSQICFTNRDCLTTRAVVLRVYSAISITRGVWGDRGASHPQSF